MYNGEQVSLAFTSVTRPTECFTILETQKPPIAVFKPYEISRSASILTAVNDRNHAVAMSYPNRSITRLSIILRVGSFSLSYMFVLISVVDEQNKY